MLVKKYNTKFYIAYSLPTEFYCSCIGIDELASKFERSRESMLRSLKKEYIKYNNKKYIVISEDDLRKSS